MRNPQGYAEIIDPGAGRLVTGFDTITCIHCGKIEMTRGPSGKLECLVFKADGTHEMREAGRCYSCWQEICPACVGKPCSNRFRKMDEDERRYLKALQSRGL
jgi:hypothetical protein